MTMTIESSSGTGRPVALITGVGRTVGIGAGIADRLAASGWNIAFTYWTPYDERIPWGIQAGAASAIGKSLSGHGATYAAVEADLADVGSPELVFDVAEQRLGNVTALVMCHCESVDSGLQQGPATIRELATQFGYGSEAAFSHAFKRVIGVSPGAVRHRPEHPAPVTDGPLPHASGA